MLFAYSKTKMQISCAVTAQLIRVFIFATRIVQSTSSLIQNFKLLVFIYDCTDLFVSDLDRNSKDWISRVMHQLGVQLFGLQLVIKLLLLNSAKAKISNTSYCQKNITG